MNIKHNLINLYNNVHTKHTNVVRAINEHTIQSEYIEDTCTHAAGVRTRMVDALHTGKPVGEVMQEVLQDDQAWDVMANSLKRDIQRLQPLAEKAKGLAWWLTGKHL